MINFIYERNLICCKKKCFSNLVFRWSRWFVITCIWRDNFWWYFEIWRKSWEKLSSCLRHFQTEWRCLGERNQIRKWKTYCEMGLNTCMYKKKKTRNKFYFLLFVFLFCEKKKKSEWFFNFYFLKNQIKLFENKSKPMKDLQLMMKNHKQLFQSE